MQSPRKSQVKPQATLSYKALKRKSEERSSAIDLLSIVLVKFRCRLPSAHKLRKREILRYRIDIDCLANYSCSFPTPFPLSLRHHILLKTVCQVKRKKELIN